MLPKIGDIVHAYNGNAYEVIEGSCGECVALGNNYLCGELPECNACGSYNDITIAFKEIV